MRINPGYHEKEYDGHHDKEYAGHHNKEYDQGYEKHFDTGYKDYTCHNAECQQEVDIKTNNEEYYGKFYH